MPDASPPRPGPPPHWAEDAERWLADDLALLTRDEGWTPVRTDVWRRAMPQDPNAMFRWRLDLAAPADLVFEVFVRRIVDYHRYFTKEFVSAEQVLDLGPDAQIVHQRFRGVFPFRPRDLCHINVARALPDGRLLCSNRPVETVPTAPGHVRLRWWGASLCVPGDRPGTSVLWYLDQENAGGMIGAWLLDLLMERTFLEEHRSRLVAFFQDGGPAELRAALGHGEG